MRDEVLSAAARKNMFLTPEALEIIDSNGYSMDFVNTLLHSLSNNSMFVTKQDVYDFLNGDKGLFEPEKVIKPRLKRDLDLTIIPGSDITGESTCEGTIEDFTNYFRSRYHILKKIICKKKDFVNCVSVNKAMYLQRECAFVGIVYDKNLTKNGHTMLTVEDEESSCKVLIGKDSAIKDELFVTDEVVGFVGKSTGSDGIFIPSKIVRPDVPDKNAWVPSDTNSSVAFLSDVHVGSKEFLESNWKSMIQWLKKNAYEQEINYLILPGDVVDGIGAYPGQENDLAIMDIYEQYESLANYLKEIPDHMKIVLHPGNHDACRLAEPQPALKEIYTQSFDSSVYMTGNPINLKIEGRTVTSYHGKSIDDWIAGVRGMSYDDPLAVMKEMMVRRHMAPMYGQRNALAPEKKDYLTLEYLPDIFVSGHVHGAGSMTYKGVRLINASTWQSQTDYQKVHNFNPDPGVMPIVHLGNGRVTMMNFMKD